MSNEMVYEHEENAYGSERFEHIRSDKKRTPRAPQGRRRGKAPQSFNGMHRRRRKKVNW